MEPTSQKKSEEIDLLQFLSPIGQLYKSIIIVAGNWARRLKKNWLTITVIVLLFVSLGFSARFVLPKQYQTNAIIITHEIPADLCVAELQNLNQTIKNEEDFSLLSQQLQISYKHAEGISYISAEKIKDIYFTNDKDTSSQLFTIQLRLKNADILDSVQAGIVQFLENNEYSRKRKDAKRASLNELKINLQKKVESLDSLKSVVNGSITPRGQGQGIILGEPIDPVSIYQAEVAYFKEQLKINEDLATLDNIEVIQPFIKIKKSNYPDFKLILWYTFLIGLVIAIIFVLLFKERNR